MTGYGDTPRKSKHTLESQFKTASISLAREIIAADTEQVPVVSVEYFQQKFLPQLIPAAKRVLESQLDGPITKNNRLYGFPKDPAASSKSESIAFRPLTDVFDQLVNLIQKEDKDAQPTVCFVYEPNRKPTTGTTNSSQPDSFLKRISGEKTLAPEGHSWEDIVAAKEYKLHRTAETEADVCQE